MLFSTTFVLNLIVWAQGSSTALPFGTLVGLAALWLLIQVPLVYAGSWVGYHRSKPWEHPTKTSSIPRQIPDSAWYSKGIYTALAAGFVPFAVIFIELLFVFRSLWQDKSGYYYVFGFLGVVSSVLFLTVVEVTIVATYVQLCSEVSCRQSLLCLRSQVSTHRFPSWLLLIPLLALPFSFLGFCQFFTDRVVFVHVELPLVVAIILRGRQ